MASTRSRSPARRPASSPTRATATRRSCASSRARSSSAARARRRAGRRGIPRRHRRRRDDHARTRRHRSFGDRDRARARRRARGHLHRRQRRDDGRSAAHSRRRARSNARRSNEMTELAEHGAKVMHHKAAEYAQPHRDALRDQGLAVPTAARSWTSAYDHRPAGDRRDVVRARSPGCASIRGDIESPTRRMETELEMFRRIADAGISIDQVTINQAGVAFVVDGDRGNDMRAPARRPQPGRARARGLLEALGRRQRHARHAGRRAPGRRRALAAPTSRSFTAPTATSRSRCSCPAADVASRGSGRARAISSRRRRTAS